MTELNVISGDGFFSFETYERTDVGLVRSMNEDSMVSMPRSGLWAVADGMGGHSAGDFASQSIVKALQTVGIPSGALDLKSRFLERLGLANQKILNHAKEQGGATIGATIAALLIQQDHFACIWSGDSRVYQLRGGSLRQISKDHTEVQALLDAGSITRAEAEAWPRKNVITRAIGVSEQLECDMVEGALRDQDLFLICSDGLTEYFDNAELEGVLNLGMPHQLEETCDHLIDTAVDRGGKDNVTVVLVRCHQNALPELEAEGLFPEYGSLL